MDGKLVMTSSNILGLLDGTAGLRLQPTSALFGGTSVRIQGLRGRYTPILTDGLPLYGSQSGSLGPLQIPLLSGGELVVKDDQVAVTLCLKVLDLLQLTLAQVVGG